MRNFSIDLIWAKIQIAITAIGGWLGYFLGGIDGLKLFAIQVIIAVVAAVFSGVLTYIIARVLKATVGWRIHGEQEHSGIDVAQHGESAYASTKQAVV